MADGLAWDDLTPELEAPGVGIRRMDAGGLAMCLIRLDAGVKTDPLFTGLRDDRCQCAHWGYIISGTMRVHGADGTRDYEAGECVVATMVERSASERNRSTVAGSAPTWRLASGSSSSKVFGAPGQRWSAERSNNWRVPDETSSRANAAPRF